MHLSDDVPRSPYGDSLPNHLLISETQDVRTVEVATHVYIGYTLLNRMMIGEAAPIVAIGGIFSDVTMPDRAWEGVQLAALNRPVLMLDMPGHGLSSPHNRRQIYDMCFRRTAESQAAPLLDAVQQVLGPKDKLDYFGPSHGAHLSLALTKLDPEDRVGTVFSLDIPAVKKQPSAVLNAGLLRDNTVGRKRYLTALQGTEFLQDFEAFKQAFEQNGPKRAANAAKNNADLFIMNLFSSINASAGSLKLWKQIMETKSANVAAVTSEKGHVSDPKAIQKFIDGLDDEYKERSSQLVVPGEDHNIGITHLLPRAVAWAKAAYKD